METKVPQQEYSEPNSPVQTLAIQGTESENLLILPPAKDSNNQLQIVSSKVSNFLAQLPEYIGRFYQDYKLPIITFALLVTAVITLRVVLALLNAVNTIPLVNPFLEIVGLCYTIWFTFRYLLQASTRQELAAEISSLKKQIVGTQDSSTLS